MPQIRGRVGKAAKAKGLSISLSKVTTQDDLSPTMRVTRSKGKRPAEYPTVEYSEPASDTEDEIMADAPAVVKAEDGPIFQMFTSNIPLKDGVNIIRNLGGNKYEILNLTTVNPQSISSEETGIMLKNDPDRLKMVNLDEKDWKQVKFNSSQAVSSANGNIFRFFKLPIELRYRIYEFAVMTPGLMRLREEPDKQLGLALMRTSRQVYQESSPFFYRNNFRILDASKDFRLKIHPKFIENVREITWEWYSFKLKDPATIRFFSELSNLRVLNLIITNLCVGSGFMYHSNKRQRLHQDDPTIKKFCKANAFDDIVQLRGLERVTAKKTTTGNFAPETKDVTDAEIAAFEVFLNKILTLPKPPPQPTKKVKKSSKKTTKGRKRRTTRKPWDYSDDEDDF